MSAKCEETTSVYILTRRQVAERLGISVSSVRRMEGGDLHPVQDERGVWRFAEAEVARLGRLGKPVASVSSQGHGGELAAHVFQYFANGYDLREIVVALQVAPDTVRDLYHQWTTSLDEGERSRREAAQSEALRAAYAAMGIE